jgi:hypothetical protein
VNWPVPGSRESKCRRHDLQETHLAVNAQIGRKIAVLGRQIRLLFSQITAIHPSGKEGMVLPFTPKLPMSQPASLDEEVKYNTLYVSGDELDFKVKEAARSRWANPLLVAICGAILVGIVNIYVNRRTMESSETIARNSLVSTERTAQSAREETTKQEKMKVENTSILEVIKFKNADDVNNGLCRLIQLGTITTADTNTAVLRYLKKQKSCDDAMTPASATAAEPGKPAEPPRLVSAQWITADAQIPGCGYSGCNAGTAVCKAVPAGTKPTGNTRNFIDSFSGAWGDWVGPPTFSSNQVCRTFNQHSHNVTRAVSFQFEVVPQ